MVQSLLGTEDSFETSAGELGLVQPDSLVHQLDGILNLLDRSILLMLGKPDILLRCARVLAKASAVDGFVEAYLLSLVRGGFWLFRGMGRLELQLEVVPLILDILR